MTDHQLNHAFEAYRKLRPRLRAVPAVFDREYGFIPHVAHIEVKKIFRTDPEEEKYSYRRDPCGGPIIIWEPQADHYPHPTFIQFVRAFYRGA